MKWGQDYTWKKSIMHVSAQEHGHKTVWITDVYNHPTSLSSYDDRVLADVLPFLHSV